jgi:membrane peptidoglycan carboxypeptidase
MDVLEKRRLLHERRTRRKGNATRWVLITGLSLVSLAAIGTAAGIGTLYAVYQNYSDGYVPIEEKIQQSNVGLTEIYDRNGVFLGRLPNPDAQLLDPVPLADIAETMKQATISTEDDAFYSHPGFNWRGIVRAAKENYIDGEFSSGTGGSSITQQLVKNIYICPSVSTDRDNVCTGAERTLDRKLKELAYAIELEQDYSKDQILEYYLNSISYADRYIGVEAASQGYFRKRASELTLAEAALLAGIPSSPSRYHPRNNCVTDDDGACVLNEDGRLIVGGDAKTRQEFVLDLMVDHQRLTRAEAEAAKAEVLTVYPSTNPVRAAAWIDNQVEPRLVRMCSQGLLPLVRGTDNCVTSVHSAGYRVTTTIDVVETEVAVAMIREKLDAGLKAGCNCHNAAIVTIDPATGQVMIYAPNVDPASTDTRIKGNIDQLTEINQPGSSFKPIVYLTWFDRNNKAPMSTFWDISPLTIEGVDIVNPRGGELRSEGLISARAALGGSQNVGAFRAAAEAGVDNVIDMAKKMGITTLDQRFDPTFQNHDGVTYGASIATGGANIRAIDLAYANAVIANMGVMVGVPTLAQYEPVKNFRLPTSADPEDARKGLAQEQEFARGNLRLEGTRALDPVTVLTVTDKDGNVLYDHAQQKDLQSKQVVDAGSVWLVHSIIGDCTSRFIIWGCGSSNDDLGLDPILNGKRIPGGAKTGTQQGFKSADDTLETWMNGYSRHAAVAVWIGNSNNELVRDGPAAGYAAANATVRLFKNWMGEYHAYLQRSAGLGEPLGFDAIRPKNVALRGFPTPATDRGLKGGCDQVVQGWVRTDVTYAAECVDAEIDTRNGLLAAKDTPAPFRKTDKFVPLPKFKPEGYEKLVKAFNIPVIPTKVSAGETPILISSPAAGRTITTPTPIVISVNAANLKKWTLEIGEGASPAAWRELASGTGAVTDAAVAILDPKDLNDSVYTLRLSVTATVNLTTANSITVRKTPGAVTPTGTPRPGVTVTPQLPGRTPTPFR